MRFAFVPLASVALLSAACTTTPSPILHPVEPRSPETAPNKPKADKPADEHAAALEQLRVAEFGLRQDRQRSVRVPLPDLKTWRRVRFLGVKSLVGFRYGADHHAVVGAFVLDVPNRTARSCQDTFEAWAKPVLESFDVRYEFGPPVGFTWRNTQRPTDPVEVMSAVTLRANVSSVLVSDTYYAAYAIYPAWPNKCLVVGFAVPAQGEDERAKRARDRYVKEAFPQLEILSAEPPTKAY